MCSRTIAAALAVSLGLVSGAAGQGGEQCAAAPAAAENPLDHGNRLAAEGRPAEALAAYEESLAVARAAGDERLATLASANALRAAVEAGRSNGIEARLAEAADAARKLADPAERTRVLIHLGRTNALLAERPEQARRALRAAALFAEAEGLAAEAGDVRFESYALGYRGGLYEQAGRLDDALTLTQRALFAAGEVRSPDATYRWQWQLGRIRRARGERELAIEAYRGAVRTLETVRVEMAAASAEAALAFRAEIEPVYVGLVDLLLARADATGEADAKQLLLLEARDTVEGLKAAELRDYFHDECLDAGRKAAADAVAGAVVVYPISLEDRVELVVSRGGRLVSYRAPVDADTLRAEALAFRRMLEKPTTREFRPHAERLYDWLIRPIEPSLDAGVDALVFVPGGALRTIPMGALRDRETGKYLLERYPIAVTPGLTLTDPQALDRAVVEVLAAGITESVQGYPALPGVAVELASVTTTFPSERLQDSQFETARFEGELQDRPFDIVHVASHGEFDADVSESFLLTYDGRISMERLAALVGRTRFRSERPLELLTLSACQTAAGDERAALGLAGVAVRAGARSVLATLWSVSDEATAALVADFYTGLAQPGVSRARALQRAQVEMIGARTYRHPAYWAPFLLINSWL